MPVLLSILRAILSGEYVRAPEAADGSIILLAVQRYRERVLQPVAGAVTTGLAGRAGRLVDSWPLRRRPRTDPTAATDSESGQPS